MVSLKDSLRKTMAHKHWGRNLIGAIVINEVRRYFGVEWRVYSDEDEYSWLVTRNSSLDGYVRFNKLFLKTSDPQIKIDVFQQKEKILARVNAAIAKVGYTTKIVDVMVK